MPTHPALQLVPRKPTRVAVRLAAILVLSLAAAAAAPEAFANCLNLGGFAIHQCADLAFFGAVPDPNFTLQFADPNDSSRVTNISIVFWQIGFGNQSLNSGQGTSGTGNSAGTTFNGNDQGTAVVHLREARAATGSASVPLGAICLGANNWGNSGIDGCSDNPRSLSQFFADDDILNPYYGVSQKRNYGQPGVYSLDWQQDYPVAVLLREPSGSFFAVAAVASEFRNNTGGNGPCATPPGTNVAACDVRPGSYKFRDVNNGVENPATPGVLNVVPWQPVPNPFVFGDTPADPNDPNSHHVLDLVWDAAVLHSDQSLRPSTNPAMAPADPTRSPGPGVADIEGAFGGLVRYIVQVAGDTDPNFVTPTSQTETTDTVLFGVTVSNGSCFRLRTLFGKKPETTDTAMANCRIGQCGDIGYEVASGGFCFDPVSGTWVRTSAWSPPEQPTGDDAGLPIDPLKGPPTTGDSTGGPGSASSGGFELTVEHGAAPGEILLNWAGGTAPYNAYMGGTTDLSRAVTVLVREGSDTSAVAQAAGKVGYFRVGDQTAPAVTITSPTDGSTTPSASVTVSVTVGAGVTSVHVNGLAAQQLSGSSFRADGVLLALGQNTITAVAHTDPDDGNIRHASVQVERLPGNQPPSIQVLSPQDGSDVPDVTPLIQVSYSDPEAGMDPNTTFRAYLDGTDVTASFEAITFTGATWQVSNAETLGLGEHVLQFTIQDFAGFTQSVSVRFRIIGPRLTSITPSKALPGSAVTINGAALGEDPNSTMVLFSGTGGTGAAIQSVSPVQIRATVPAGATDGPVTVRVNGIESNPLPFDIAFTSAGGTAYWVAIDSQGRIYRVSSNLQQIIRMNQDGTGSTTFFSTSDEITGMAFDPAGTTLYVLTRGDPVYESPPIIYQTGRIYSIAPTGAATLRSTLPAAAGSYCDAGGIDARPPYVYVGAILPDTSQVALRIDLNTQAKTAMASLPLGNTLVFDLKVDDSGNIYWIWVDSNGNPGLYRGPFLHFTGSYLTGIAVDCRSTVYLTDGGAGQVLKVLGSFSGQVIADLGAVFPFAVDIDAKGSLFIGTDSAVQRLTNFTVTACAEDFGGTLTGDAAKVLADYDPKSGTETPDSQFVVLTACLSDPLVPRLSTDRVYWTMEDVDDPATDAELDPNGPAGGDNLGGFDGSAPFTQEGSYGLLVGSLGDLQYGTIYDSAGCSKVQFHFSDAPGDNFQVKARLRTQLGDAIVKSRTMTVWKRAHVQLDSMGMVTGTPDPTGDDAVIGDIPDPPATALLEALFRPAYVEIFHDGPGTATNVAFDGHVPDLRAQILTQLGRQQMNAQGQLGRESTYSSSTGVWRLYVQGSYEGPNDYDLDPATEGGALGLTNISQGRYSFAFTEVIRDAAAAPQADFPETYLREAVLLHELGHQFGLPNEGTSDGTGGIMEEIAGWPSPRFIPRQLRQVRSIGQQGGFPSSEE